MKFWIAVFLFAGAAFGQTEAELRSMVRLSLERLADSEKTVADYGFIRRSERKEFHSNGELKSRRSSVIRREHRDGFMVVRTLERDGKPLSEEESRLEEEGVRRQVAELKAKSPEELAKMREDNLRKSREDDSWLREIPDALQFKLAGEEVIHGRPALVIECSPRPGYHAKNLRARVFEKARGRIWIDKAEPEMAKVDAEMFDTVNVGWGFLAKIQKGTRFMLQRRRVGKGAWMPEEQFVKFSVRAMLVKTIRNEIHNQYSDFRHREETARAGGR